MNKWKNTFWSCFVMLVIISVISIYQIVNLSITNTNKNEGYSDTENDLDLLIAIINKTELTKSQIANQLKNTSKL